MIAIVNGYDDVEESRVHRVSREEAIEYAIIAMDLTDEEVAELRANGHVEFSDKMNGVTWLRLEEASDPI